MIGGLVSGNFNAGRCRAVLNGVGQKVLKYLNYLLAICRNLRQRPTGDDSLPFANKLADVSSGGVDEDVGAADIEFRLFGTLEPGVKIDGIDQRIHSLCGISDGLKMVVGLSLQRHL